MDTRTSIDWSLSGGEMVSFDDGHVPENLKNDDDTCSTRLVNYPRFFNHRPAAVHVLDSAASSNLVDALYELTVRESQPWGDYVTIEQVQGLWKQQQEQYEKQGGPAVDSTRDKEELAIHAVASFLKNAMSQKVVSMRYTNDSNTGEKNEQQTETETVVDSNNGEESTYPLLFDESDLRRAHGVAIWALAADEGSRVPYHLDYAEQIRYESNVIVPPVLAGVLHCTSARVEGGDYCAHLDGLEHYEKYGYKGAKQKLQEGGSTSEVSSVLPVEEDPGWVQVSYKYNRMIWQSGHLPHLSTTVRRLSTTGTDTADKPQSDAGSRISFAPKRVIVGFNVFLHDVGPTVQLAPEHSAAFRRKVKVQRFLSQKRLLSLSLVQQNPSLAKMLVLAKRTKLKQEFCQKQQELNGEIRRALQPRETVTAVVPVSVSELMKQFGRSDGVWPSAADVQVQIHYQCQDGRLSIVQGDKPHDVSSKKMGLVLPEQMVRLPMTSTDGK
jgi:hypothetical protein